MCTQYSEQMKYWLKKSKIEISEATNIFRAVIAPIKRLRPGPCWNLSTKFEKRRAHPDLFSFSIESVDKFGNIFQPLHGPSIRIISVWLTVSILFLCCFWKFPKFFWFDSQGSYSTFKLDFQVLMHNNARHLHSLKYLCQPSH